MSIENPQALVEQVLDYMDTTLKTRVGTFLDVALETLHDQGHAESGGQASSRAAGRWLNENRAAVSARFPQRMREAFLGRAPAQSVSVDELQLLEDAALVNVIVRARIVAVMEKARLAASTLDPRLDALHEAGGKINARSLAPGVVADEFVAVLSELSVVRYIQLPLREVYGLCGVEMLIDVYDDLNQLLMQHGVLPDDKTAHRPRADAEPGRQWRPGTGHVERHDLGLRRQACGEPNTRVDSGRKNTGNATGLGSDRPR